MNDGLIETCYFMIVCFIDIELVGATRGIDDRTSVPFPCYDIRVSNAAGVVFVGSHQISKPDEEMVY